jgi:hypothetical protein
MVAGPSGVSEVRQIAPASSDLNVGSPLPRPCTESVRRTSTANGATHSRSAIASAIAGRHHAAEVRQQSFASHGHSW